MEMLNSVISPSFSPFSPSSSFFEKPETSNNNPNKKSLDDLRTKINGINNSKNCKFSEDLSLSEEILEDIIEFMSQHPKFNHETSIINPGITSLQYAIWDIELDILQNSVKKDELLDKLSQINEDLSLKFEELKLKYNTHWTGSRIKMFKGVGMFNSIFSKYHLDLKYENVKPITGTINNKKCSDVVVKKLYDGKIVAEKNIGKNLYKKQDKSLLQDEIVRMKALEDCVNIQQIYGYTHQGSCYYVISKWADYNLQSYLKQNNNIDWTTKLNIASGVADALNFCHEHGDLNPILYNFGTSEAFGIIFKPVNHEKDDPRWTAPELLGKKKKCTTESDVYSFSILLWEIDTQKEPFGGYGNFKYEFLKNKIIYDHKRPELEFVAEECDEYINIMKQGWNFDPSKRPTMLEMKSRLFVLEKLYIMEESVENVFESFSSSSSSTCSHSSRASSIATSVNDDYQLLLSSSNDDGNKLLLPPSSKPRSISAPQKLEDNHIHSSDCEDLDFDGKTLNEDDASRLSKYSFTTFREPVDIDNQQTIEEQPQQVFEQKDIECIEQQQSKSSNNLLTQTKSIFRQPESVLKDAKRYYAQKDYENALKIFKEHEGIYHTAELKRLVGLCYLNLKSEPPVRNKKLAAKYLNEASEGGDRIAKYEYAMAIHNNKIKVETRERYKFIKELLEDSAKQDYAPAFFKMGQFHNNGDCDFKKDPELAKRYHEKSRELKGEPKKNRNNNEKIHNQSRDPIRRQHTKNSLSLSINTTGTTKIQNQRKHKKFRSEFSTLSLPMSRSQSHGSFV
ncbi:6538_t:CDS:2 [Entrophospora sp. SA101]|nr:6538_t:CDS:2 [Entrophospora sp. SA101]CAJ0828398.1 13845_t:CDS:2 [Entrophospora sp. SA101]CAJ0885933.1 11682_t:CDS:2 [Entrophospora sp. SA101]